MKASAFLAVDAVDGIAYASDVGSEPPFAIRRAGGKFLFVGTAAAPVRGDVLEIFVDIAPGVTAEIGTVAATIVWPGPDPFLLEPSRLTTIIKVGAGARLIWRPEPTVSVAGSDHISHTVVQLAENATCEIVEEYSLGRSGEPGGRLSTDLRVVRGGKTLVRHGEFFEASLHGSSTVATLGSARHFLAGVVVGPSAGEPKQEVFDPAMRGGLAAAWLPVAADAATLLAAGLDRPSVLGAAARVCPRQFV